jgi:hypothetical protein
VLLLLLLPLPLPLLLPFLLTLLLLLLLLLLLQWKGGAPGSWLLPLLLASGGPLDSRRAPEPMMEEELPSSCSSSWECDKQRSST